jgi:hypothetical protein
MTPDVGYLRIATEEAFAPPELISMWQSMLADGTCDDPGFISLPGFYLRSTAERPAAILARLQDLGERRIADMDAAGVDRQIISLTCPGRSSASRSAAPLLSRPGEPDKPRTSQPFCPRGPSSLRRLVASRACGRIRSSSGPRPGPWRARLRSR